MKKNLLRNLLNEVDDSLDTPAKVVRATRKQMGFTLKDIESITGILESNLSAIENEKIEMTKQYAEIFGAVLGLHPSSILYPNGIFQKNSDIKQIEAKAIAVAKKATKTSSQVLRKLAK